MKRKWYANAFAVLAIGLLDSPVQSWAQPPTSRRAQSTPAAAERRYRVSVGEVEYSISVSTPEERDVTRVVVTTSDDQTPRTFEDWHRGPLRIFRGSTLIYERIVGGLKAEDWPVTAGSFKSSLAALPTVKGFRGSEAAQDLLSLERDTLVLYALGRQVPDHGLGTAAIEPYLLIHKIHYDWGERTSTVPDIVIHKASQ